MIIVYNEREMKNTDNIEIPYERLYKCDCCGELAFKCDRCRKIKPILDGGTLVEKLDMILCKSCTNTKLLEYLNI